MQSGFADAFIAAVLLAFASAHGALAQPAARQPNAAISAVPGTAFTGQSLAVALSHDAYYLASIVLQNGHTRLVLSGWSGAGPRVMPIPGGCRITEVRWAPRVRWHELAILTRCTPVPSAHAPLESTLWVLNLSARRPLRKVATVDGFVGMLEWSEDLQHLEFLYVPGATHALPRAVPHNILTGRVGRYAGRTQEVAEVPISGGVPHALTPAGWYVFEFRPAPAGAELAYLATPAGATGGRAAAALYTQARPGARPRRLVDPATMKGTVHGQQIGVMRWNGAEDLVFIAGPMTDLGAVRGNLYLQPADGGGPILLTYQKQGRQRASIFWFEDRSGLIATQLRGNQIDVDQYTMGIDYARDTARLFTLPRIFGNGRAPLSLSLAGGHAAFIGGTVPGEVNTRITTGQTKQKTAATTPSRARNADR